jgi:hypothetical protein
MRRCSNLSLLLLPVLVVFVVSSFGAGGPDLPEPGPENGDLRLRLSIVTSRKDNNDHYSVRLGIINVGSSAVTLVSRPSYERHSKDYGAYLKSQVSFITFPEILPRSGQTAGAEPKSPLPKVTIKPQKEYSLGWQSSGRLLKREDSFNTTPHFPGPGLYSVRAEVVVRTKDGKEILLYSNEQPVSVEGSVEMPKHATARVWRSNSEDATVIMGLGAGHKIEKGDKFMVQGGGFSWWELTVRKTMEWSCEAKVKRHVVGLQIDKVPPRYATAQLMAFEAGL